ncbi:MAG TPA: SPOR domain-containing protein, partial [Gammaproteobacteria bacterium]|nr:SPOR domain-containing protein [Gammaproteobacteria bacterium]
VLLLLCLTSCAVSAHLIIVDAKADEVKGRRSTVSAGLYAINLESSLTPPAVDKIPANKLLRRYRLYTDLYKKDSRVWHRLRLGFFETRAAAKQAQAALRSPYPRSWVTKVSAAEHDASAATAIALPGAAAVPVPTPQPLKVAAASRSQRDSARLGSLMERARRAMAEGNYDFAVKTYTEVLQYPHSQYSQAAQEFLGLARERKGQVAHAKAEYETYLKLYPTGEGADRVRQRLAGLLTARKAPPKKLRRVAQAAQETPAWDTFGSFSQYYRRDVSDAGNAGQQVNLSMLSSYLDVMTRRTGSEVEVRTRFTGGYDWDFLDSRFNQTRITSLYAAMSDRRLGIGGRLGRQSLSTGGVLGRFDGLSLGYQLTPRLKLNAVAGFPVEINTLEQISTGKRFYGASVDVGTFVNGVNVNTYFIQQTAHGMLDRRAVGSELRYSKANRSLFALVDYDIYFNTLNTLFAFGNWIFADDTSVNVTIDLRKSPVLTTSNALQGQTVASVNDLLSQFSERQIKQLAKDRTADSRTFTVGVTRPINRMLQVSGNVTMTHLSGTPASGGVAAIDGTGNDVYYTMQLIGSSLIKKGDLAIIGLNYADASTAKTASVTLNTRYPVNHSWRINPRFRVDLRRFTRDNSHELLLAPSLRVNYRILRVGQIEFEGGGLWSTLHVTGDTQNTTGYYVNAGYRLDF